LTLFLSMRKSRNITANMALLRQKRSPYPKEGLLSQLVIGLGE
jgi:hypothetical protein